MEASCACIHSPEIPSYLESLHTNMHDLAVLGLQVQGEFSKETTGPSVLYMYYSKIALSTVSYLYICRVLSIGELSQKAAPDSYHEVHFYIHKESSYIMIYISDTQKSLTCVTPHCTIHVYIKR